MCIILMAIQYSIAWIYQNLFNQFFIAGHLDFFLFKTVISNNSETIFVHKPLHTRQVFFFSRSLFLTYLCKQRHFLFLGTSTKPLCLMGICKVSSSFIIFWIEMVCYPQTTGKPNMIRVSTQDESMAPYSVVSARFPFYNAVLVSNMHKKQSSRRPCLPLTNLDLHLCCQLLAQQTCYFFGNNK